MLCGKLNMQNLGISVRSILLDSLTTFRCACLHSHCRALHILNAHYHNQSLRLPGGASCRQEFIDTYCSRALVVCAAVLLPTLAYAQAQIVGAVRDESGGVLPGVTVEACQPGDYRESPHGRHRRPGTLPHRSAAARHLQADIFADRLQHGRARRTSTCRRKSSSPSTPT